MTIACSGCGSRVYRHMGRLPEPLLCYRCRADADIERAEQDRLTRALVPLRNAEADALWRAVARRLWFEHHGYGMLAAAAGHALRQHRLFRPRPLP